VAALAFEVSAPTIPARMYHDGLVRSVRATYTSPLLVTAHAWSKPAQTDIPEAAGGRGICVGYLCVASITLQRSLAESDDAAYHLEFKL
jgi:hypothetical protein